MTVSDKIDTKKPLDSERDVDVDEEKSSSIKKTIQKTISSTPQSNREDTVKTLEALCDSKRPSPSDVYGRGPMLISDIPSSARKGAVILGIDEAGRGPVLGPMTYAAAYWNADQSKSIPKGFNDSKQLTEKTRLSLLQQAIDTPDICFVLRVLHASEISRNMLRSDPYNLNAMSHDAAIGMIRAVLDAGVKIDTAYIDTVGMPDAYRSRLEREFNGHGIRFVVEKKADAKYAPCSAASVVAKVSRDKMIENWKWSEASFEPDGGIDFGSGYPSDPKCKKWLDQNLLDPVFCFPDLVRFSWGPSKNAMKDKGVLVEWEADEDEEDNQDSDGVARQQLSMSSFVVGGKTNDTKKENLRVKKKRRTGYFEKLGLRSVTTIIET
mmetsp:Transcript_4733/g.6721  ORF Transcript_4733/g.6721 Transcript_4733/m.6721 type:complete len:380 (-) Transcript_4733:7-1146(-)